MTRAALFVIFYAFVGTIVAMVGYRLVLDGPLATPDEERTLDGLILFISILLNTALIFGAAGLTVAMVYPLRNSWIEAALASAVLAAVVSYLMTFWFRGLNFEYPIIVTLSTLACAGIARALRVFGMCKG
ncbi:MAG TPA: hypothetical protein VH765_14080 [Xanthobacteraceae bacterium]|jgi:hypothetical protein